MTNRELVNILLGYPSDMEVKVSCGRRIWPVRSVLPIVELGDNIVSIDIRADDSANPDWK